MLPFCPESPKYLLITKNNPSQAEKAMAWFRNSWEVEQEVADMKETNRLLLTLPPVTLKSFWVDARHRTTLVVCISLMVAQQLSGINSVR